MARTTVATLVLALALAATASGRAAASQIAPEAAWHAFTVAGNGWEGVTTQGLAATRTPMTPTSVAALPAGGFLVASAADHRVYAVAPTGVVTVVAGTGSDTVSGDGGPATRAGLGAVGAVTALPSGGFVIAEGPPGQGTGAHLHPRIRRVLADGSITTIAGGDTSGFSGDGGPATAAALGDVVALASAPDGALLVVDAGAAFPPNERVRRIAPDGVITTVAGTGVSGFSGDGGPATRADLQGPAGVATLGDGGLLIADTLNRRVRRVLPDGTITTVAGDGGTGPGLDGVAAVATQLDGPVAVAAAPDGGAWIADRTRLRRIGLDGVIRAVTSSPACRHEDITGAGTGIFDGDGRQARCAAMAGRSLASLPDGGLLIADAARAVKLITPATSGLAAIAITSTSVARAAVQVNFRSIVPGEVHVQLVRGGAVVDETSTLTPGGDGIIVVRRPAGTGVVDLRLTVTSAAGDAGAEVGLHLGRVTEATARASILRFFSSTSGLAARLRSCRRFTDRRVDCELVTRAPTGATRCSAVLAFEIRASGLAGFRAYACGPRNRRFRWAPRWDTAQWAQRWPPPLRLGLMPAPLLGATGDASA